MKKAGMTKFEDNKSKPNSNNNVNTVNNDFQPYMEASGERMSIPYQSSEFDVTASNRLDQAR